MADLAFYELKSLIAELAEGRDNSEILDEIRRSHSGVLEKATPYIQTNAMTNIVRNLRRSPAIRSDGGTGDLFSIYGVPLMHSVPSVDGEGNRTFKNESTGKWKKAELRVKIEQLESRQNRPPKIIEGYRRILNDLDEFCEDDETLDTGMKRRGEAA